MQTEVVFENIEAKIKAELSQAQKSIHLAVAWFTDKDLFAILRAKAQNGCEVQIIINDDEINNSSPINFDDVQQKHLRIFKMDTSERELMHHKFCVIDESTSITGSYNWSYKAQTNFENILITRGDHILATQYLDEFNRIVHRIHPQAAEHKELLPLHVIVKRLEIVKNFILLEERASLRAESEKLSRYAFNADIAEIIALLTSDNYALAIPVIEHFIRQHQQIALWTDKEIAILKTEVRKCDRAFYTPTSTNSSLDG